ncbi:MAG: NADPH:quinone reductase [unclassified Hahellaceae]|nr:NADPH:quinone reductase [Hahellaceae bacterium]|tara:strand:+ start:23009 stop:23587 length:579 start_codon:yes stop_codon:yes gene_type:complete
MNSKRVLVVAHPPSGSFGHALAEAYVAEAERKGHEVRVIRLDQLIFDPVLRKGYRMVQALEPDLQSSQADILWAEHLVFVYPVWWGSIPALMKGFLDRTFLPGFAFKYMPGKMFPKQLLKGRSAHLLITMDTPPWYFQWAYRAPAIHQMKKTTLEFCGVRPVRTLAVGPVLNSTAAKREAWLNKARRLAARI